MADKNDYVAPPGVSSGQSDYVAPPGQTVQQNDYVTPQVLNLHSKVIM